MKCPHCRETIEHLKYEADYTDWGNEWGSANLDGCIEDTDGRDCMDGETTEIVYRCPECDLYLNVDDLIKDEPEELVEETAGDFNKRNL